MVLRLAIPFLLASSVIISCIESIDDNEQGTLWVLLIASDDGWDNSYRHQADVLHAYHVLIDRGVNPDNIVTMVSDDIANNWQNPYPGQVFNGPEQVDVYAGAKIDYNGSSITPKNFLAVLSGNKTRVKGGNGRVIESGPNDRVFVYLADHGGHDVIEFPEDLLTKHELQSTIKKMHANKKYRQLTFYIEACLSGSMFHGTAPELNVYAVTAANETVDSWGAYCPPIQGCDPGNKSLVCQLETCLGDVFSLNWIRDSAKHKQGETLEQQFKTVQHETIVQKPDQPVSHYGNLSIAKQPVSDFEGVGSKEPKVVQYAEITGLWPSRDIPRMLLESRRNTALKRGNSEKAEKLQQELNDLEQSSRKLERYVHRVVHLLTESMDHSAFSTSAVNKNPQCHSRVVKSFASKCSSVAKNPNALTYSSVFINLCNQYDTKKIVDTLDELCREA
ncbi:legumain 1 [Aphelenchoides avenae]|nr:legumain 1 [Aphelenchus avenae]